jgi:hypothetical protein
MPPAAIRTKFPPAPQRLKAPVVTAATAKR